MPHLQILRALIPSWRFFDEPAPVPTLLARVSAIDGEPGPWLECLPKSGEPRSWGRLFLNSEENCALAARALLGQLLDDLDDSHGSRAVSLGLVENLVASRISGTSPRFSFQFKISEAGEALFLSPVIFWPR